MKITIKIYKKSTTSIKSVVLADVNNVIPEFRRVYELLNENYIRKLHY